MSSMQKMQFGAMVDMVIANAVLYAPQLSADLNKVRQYDCLHRYDPVASLEHVVALVASEFPGNDREYLRKQAFQTGQIDPEKPKSVDISKIKDLTKCSSGWSIEMEDCKCFSAPEAPDGYEPKVGSEVWQHTVGNCFYSIIIDGHVFSYETVAQRNAKFEAEVQKRRAEERAKFPEYDQRLAKLPEVFQERIRKFQRAPNFREDLEGYELFACEQAVIIAKRLKTVKAVDKCWHGGYGKQSKMVPELKEAGHSGNSLGFAFLMAHTYLESPESVLRVPGALSPLVGSDAYLPLEERHTGRVARFLQRPVV